MAKPVYILGLSFFYHDSAAVLLKDGEIVFAAQEERYTREKHDEDIPLHAVRAALAFASITIDDVSAVGFYEKPLLKFFDRILSTYFKVWPRGLFSYHHAMQEWMTRKLWIPQHIRKELKYKGDIFFIPPHEAHAASSFFCSGFPDATIVTVDGVGEWATTTFGKGEGKNLSLKKEIHFPHSLGLLYSAITYYLGFKVNSAEYKVMGLAPYGQPKYMEEMRKLIEAKEDGSFRLNMEYFTYEYGLRMTGRKLEQLLGHPRRDSEGPLEQFHKDVARSLQEITEEVMLKIVRHAKEVCPSRYLCLAGGVALNCVANGKILRTGLFDDIFIQPAAGDAGGALGSALLLWHRLHDGARLPRMEQVYLGDAFSNEEIETLLKKEGYAFEKLSDASLIERVSGLLEGENVIGWFQGRMEYGPRALGNRSIIADARNVADVQPDKRKEIPAVTHVDGSARIQTIRRDQNPKYYDLIKAFADRTGCPVIINTSFNVRGEPIVRSPEDALNCFLHTHMDYLVLGNCLLSKENMSQVSKEAHDAYMKKFTLD